MERRRPQPHGRATFPNSTGRWRSCRQCLRCPCSSKSFPDLCSWIFPALFPSCCCLPLPGVSCARCGWGSGGAHAGCTSPGPQPLALSRGKTFAPAAARAPAWIMPPGAIGFSRKLPLLDAIDLGSPTVPVSRHQRLLETLSWRQKIYGKAGGLMKYSWEFLSSVFTRCKKAIFIFSELWIEQ